MTWVFQRWIKWCLDRRLCLVHFWTREEFEFVARLSRYESFQTLVGEFLESLLYARSDDHYLNIITGFGIIPRSCKRSQ